MPQIKKRYWWFVLYPESVEPDWKELLTMRGLPFAVSPLHEYDLDTEGVLKKPHYHVILAYPGPTTFNNVKALTVDELKGTIPKYIDNIRGAYDYLTHKNHPAKFQYSEDEIEFHNGFDLLQFVNMSEMDKAEISISIIQDIKDNKIKEYSRLLNFYIELGDFQKFNYCCSHTIMLTHYLSSVRHGGFDEKE